MQVKPKIYFRADGNSKIGLGHIYRCLALMEMLAEDFDCVFLTRYSISSLSNQIVAVCSEVIKLNEEIDYLTEAQGLAKNELTPNSIVVLDGYHFGTEYQQFIKESGHPLVCIDDILSYHFLADIVINHAGGISEDMYAGESYTKYLLGLKYAILRKEFRTAAQQRNRIKKENNLFICLGGADPKNDTIKVLKSVANKFNVDRIYIVLGSASNQRVEVAEYIDNVGLPAEILSNLNADEMVYYMNKCQKAITSPSTISYEYLSTGGELYLYKIADNQQKIMEYFLSAGLAFKLSDYPVSEDKITNALAIQRELLNGKAAEYFITEFNHLIKC